MMKKYLYLLLIVIVGCDSTDAWDCLKKEGAQIREEIILPEFTKIRNGKGIQLVIDQGDVQQVVLETGENLRDDIQLEVIDGVLQVESLISCNFVRPYQVTTVYVTVPNLTEIVNNSPYTVSSQGRLKYPSLALISENAVDKDNEYTNGDFQLELEVEELRVVANSISNFFLQGTATSAHIGLYSGDSRFEGQHLEVKNLTIYQRSSNKMKVRPIESIQGEIRGIGDVIAYHQPPIVEVIEYYTGQLIFK